MYLCQISPASQILLVLVLISIDSDACLDSIFCPAAHSSHWAREVLLQPVSKRQTKLSCRRHRSVRELGTCKGWEVSGLWTPIPFRQCIKTGTFRLMLDWLEKKYFLTFLKFRIPWSVFGGGIKIILANAFSHFVETVMIIKAFWRKTPWELCFQAWVSFHLQRHLSYWLQTKSIEQSLNERNRDLKIFMLKLSCGLKARN